MIISRWKGFEIDSSEGYYAFERDFSDKELGREFVRKLIASPLLWSKVSFTLLPQKDFKKELETYLHTKLKENSIEKFRHEFPDELKSDKNTYDFNDDIDDHLPSHIQPEFVSTPSFSLDIFEDSKNFLSLLSLNFCIGPLKNLPKDEYNKLQKWFLKQFKNEDQGKNRWSQYCDVEETDFELRGNTELCNCPELADPFEANVELFSESFTKKSSSLRFNAPAKDPSLMIYLLFQLTDSFFLQFRGNHYNFDETPDKIKKMKIGYNLDEDSIHSLKPEDKN